MDEGCCVGGWEDGLFFGECVLKAPDVWGFVAILQVIVVSALDLMLPNWFLRTVQVFPRSHYINV